MQVQVAPNVEVSPFDGEGTGMQCFRYQEYTAEPIRFRIDAWQDGRGTVYSAFVNGKAFASVSSANDPSMHSCCSFIEDIQGGAPSVYLRYRGLTASSLDVQLRIHRTAPKTFYVACGFARGYLGIRDDGNDGQQRILFSVWSPGSTCIVTHRSVPEPRKLLARSLVSREASFRPHADGQAIKAAQFTAVGDGPMCAQVESPWFTLATGGERVRPMAEWPVGGMGEL